MENIALIAAAGSSSRFSESVDKLYCLVNGAPVIEHSINAFLLHPMIDGVCVVVSPNAVDRYKRVTSDIALNSKLMPYVIGGSVRQQSVSNGLNFISQYHPKKVLIHDAARPFVSPNLITSVISALDQYEAVDVLLPVVDTIKRRVGEKFDTVDRSDLYQTQTPQGFIFPIVHQLHLEATQEATDSISLCLQHHVSLSCVKGEIENYKITHIEDIR